MNGIHLSRSPNFDFQMRGGGRQNIHEAKYDQNMTGEQQKKHFQSYINIMQKSSNFDYISTCARKGLTVFE
jgi:hypothetical protein